MMRKEIRHTRMQGGRIMLASLYLAGLLLMPFTSASARDFIAREHLVVDLRHGIEWLRCSVGQTWNGQSCDGEIVRLNHEEIAIAITQANEQLGGKWRLPSREELEGLVCAECPDTKIDLEYFPDTVREPYWTGEVNSRASRHIWSVNFFTGYTYGRFFPDQQLAVRLVRAR